MTPAARRKVLKDFIAKGLLPADFDIDAEIVRLEEQDRTNRTTTVWSEIHHAYGVDGPKAGMRWASPMQTATLANLAVRWVEKHEAAALDDAMEYCLAHKLPVLPPLLRHVVDAVRERRKKTKSPLSPAMRAGIKDEAFRIMANLICLNVTLDRASEVAAIHSARTGRPLKASTLAKEYAATWHRGTPNREDEMRAHRAEFPEPEFDRKWLEIESLTPLPTQEQKGERR